MHSFVNIMCCPNLFFITLFFLFTRPHTTTQTHYEKNNDRIGDFGSKLLISFLMSAFHSFLKYLHYRQRQTAVTLKIQNLVWITSARPVFWPFVALAWVSTDISETTGIDQLTHRRVMFRRLVFLNFTAETWWKSIVALFTRTHNHFHTLCRLRGSNICKFV